MIEIVELPELVCIGYEIEADWQDLAVLMPDLWQRLFASDTGATSFLEVSSEPAEGRFRELVGFLAARSTEIPDGMTKRVLPAGRYLRLHHEGPLSGIAHGFQLIHDHAAATGQRTGDLKLDFGYTPGLIDTRHELHVALESQPLLLG